MHALEQTIEESVGHGRFSEGGVPHGDGELAGDDRGAPLHSVFDDFEHVGGLIGTERTDQKIVDEQHVDAGPVGEEVGEAAFGAWAMAISSRSRRPRR